MKIRELLEAAPVDQTTKDAAGNYIGFDQTRKVWVTIPRYEGIGLIKSGQLSNGQLTIKTKYPEFKPPAASAAPKAPQATPAGQGKVGAWMANKDQEWRGVARSGFKQGIRNIKGMIGLKGY
jgi:hypothetical protein